LLYGTLVARLIIQISTSNKEKNMKKQILSLVATLSLLSLPSLSSTAVAANVNQPLEATAKVTAKCIVRSATNIAFTVDSTVYANYDATGTVVTRCSKGTPVFIFVAPTTAGAALEMKSGTAEKITYAIYSDTGRTTVFPSATGGAKVASLGADLVTSIYGRVVVASGVNDTVLAADNYTQALTATIEW
jgi:spore coat protein U-like protein